MKEFLDKIFNLPPVEQRKSIGSSFLSIFINVEKPSEEKDDIYVYYLAVRAVWRLGCAIGVLMLLVYCSEKLQISFGWDIPSDYKHTRMNYFFEQYNLIFVQAVLFILFPFYLIKFLWNINPKEYDVLAFDPRYGVGKKYQKKWWRVIPDMCIWFLVGLFLIEQVYRSPFAIPFELLNTDTALSLIFFIAVTLTVASFSLVLLIKAVAVIGRFLGPYKGSSP